MWSPIPRARPGIGALPLLLSITLLAACTGDDDPALVSAIERALAAQLGVEAKVGGAELDLVGRRVTARDVVLSFGTGEAAARPWLKARTVVLGATVSATEVDLRHVELEGVELDLDPARGGLWPASPGGGAGGEGSVERLRLRDGELTLRAGDVGVRLHVDELSVAPGDGGRAIDLIAGPGTLQRADAVQPLTLLTAHATLTREELQLQELKLAGPQLALSLADGRAPRPLGSSASARASGKLDLARLMPWLQHPSLSLALPPLSGALEGEGELQWREGRLTGAGRVEVGAPRVGEVPLGERLTLSIKQQAGRLKLEGHDELGPGQGTLAVHGHIDGDAARSAHFTVGINGVPLSALRERLGHGPVVPLSMRLDGDVELEGTLDPPALAGALALRGSEVEVGGDNPSGLAIAGLALSGRAELAAGQWTVKDARLELPQGAKVGGLQLTRVSARVDFGANALEEVTLEGRDLAVTAPRIELAHDAERALETELAIERIRLADLRALAGLGPGSELARVQAVGNGRAQLRHREGRGLELGVDLALADARAFGIPFEGGALKATLHGGRRGRLQLEELSLQRAGGQGGAAVLKGEVHATGARTLELSLTRVALGGLFGLSSGRLSGGGTLGGTQAAPAGRLELRLAGARAHGEALGDARVTAVQLPAGAAAPAGSGCKRAREALAQLGAGWMICGRGLRDRLELDLALASDRARSLRGQVRLQGVELSPWLPPPFDGEHGRASANLQVELEGGGLDAPGELAGRVRLERLRLAHGQVSMQNEEPVAMTLAAGRLEVPPLQLVGKRSDLTLRGHLSAADGFAIEGAGKVAASLLSGLTDWSRQAYGEVGIELTLEGPLDGPSLRGKLRPDGVLVQVDPTGLPVRQVRGLVSFDADQLRLSPLIGQVGDGEVKLEGEVTLADARITSYQLNLSARDVDVEPQERFSLAFDADVQIERVGSGIPRWTGTLKLSRLLYGRHIQLPEALTALNRQERKRQASYDPARDRFQIDLRVIDAGDLRIRNNFLDADVEAPAGLRIVGSDQRFGLLGELGVADGRVLFRGDEFTVTRGHMKFEDPRRVAPSFDVRGVARARKRKQAQIVFEAKGDRERFALDVHCEPAPGDDAGVPPPFACAYDDDQLRCDGFDQLLTLWLCQGG